MRTTGLVEIVNITGLSNIFVLKSRIIVVIARVVDASISALSFTLSSDIGYETIQRLSNMQVDWAQFIFLVLVAAAECK